MRVGHKKKGVREHPELSVGSNTDGIDVRSVGNSAVLQDTCLVEAFNLKVRGTRGSVPTGARNHSVARWSITIANLCCALSKPAFNALL